MDRASDILVGLAAERPDSEDWTEELTRACWEAAVGAQMARFTRPATLAGRLLIVEVDSQQWVHELESLAGSIRHRLNRSLGRDVVGRLVYRLRRTAKPAGRASTSTGEPTDPIRRRIYRDAEGRG